jgi:hypothetical protein
MVNSRQVAVDAGGLYSARSSILSLLRQFQTLLATQSDTFGDCPRYVLFWCSRALKCGPSALFTPAFCRGAQ